MKLLRLSILVAPTLLLVACGQSSSNLQVPPAPTHIDVGGTWDDPAGNAVIITDTQWGTGTIVKFDNTQTFAVVQSPANAPESPNTFAKLVWTKPQNGSFNLCAVDANEPTEVAAETTAKKADATNLMTGCAGAPWVVYGPHVPDLEIAGTWDDNYGGTTTITKKLWGTDKITTFDNTARWAVLQSPPDDMYTPNKFSKNVWTAPSMGGFYYCTVDYGLDTADAAKNTTKTADASDLDGKGCGGFPWTKMVPHVPAIEIVGTWDDNYGGTTTITKTKWGTDSLVSFDNSTRYAIVQSPPDDMYTPNKFSKNVWTAPQNNVFYYCTVDYGRDTADAAKNTMKTADATDLDGKGCGGFPWTKMSPHVPAIEIVGTWDDNYGDTITITKTMWGTESIISFDNTMRYTILQSPANDMYTPNKFSKNVWTAPQNNVFYYCTVDYGLDTADAAKNTTKTADPNDLDGKGCGGFPWSKMSPHASM